MKSMVCVLFILMLISSESSAQNFLMCGGSRYLQNSGVCCQNKLTATKNGACCQSSGYNNMTESCCTIDYSVVKYPNAKACYDVKFPNLKQCYDPREQLCCDGALQTLYTASTKCCGQKVYSTTNAFCCNGTTITNGRNGRMCGNQCFDPSSQTCCLNAYINNGFAVSCCGALAFSPAISTCCNDVITPGAFLPKCGSACFNRSNQVCCEKTVFNGTACCGAQ